MLHHNEHCMTKRELNTFILGWFVGGKGSVFSVRKEVRIKARTNISGQDKAGGAGGVLPTKDRNKSDNNTLTDSVI